MLALRIQWRPVLQLVDEVRRNGHLGCHGAQSEGSRGCATEAVAGGSHARQRGTDAASRENVEPTGEAGGGIGDAVDDDGGLGTSLLVSGSQTVLHYAFVQQSENALIRDRLVLQEAVSPFLLPIPARAAAPRWRA